jgi:hypothetical protein
MRVARTVLREIAGLFVDDGSLALAVVVLVVAVALCLRLHVEPLLGAALLLIGLAGILAENVRRAARKQRRGDTSRSSGSTL